MRSSAGEEDSGYGGIDQRGVRHARIKAAMVDPLGGGRLKSDTFSTRTQADQMCRGMTAVITVSAISALGYCRRRVDVESRDIHMRVFAVACGGPIDMTRPRLRTHRY